MAGCLELRGSEHEHRGYKVTIDVRLATPSDQKRHLLATDKYELFHMHSLTEKHASSGTSEHNVCMHWPRIRIQFTYAMDKATPDERQRTSNHEFNELRHFMHHALVDKHSYTCNV